MPYSPIYSKDLSAAKIRLIFCRARFNKRISCIKCGSYSIRKCSERQFRCQSCWAKFAITTDTWLNRNKHSFRFWYEIVWCFVLKHPAYVAHQLLKTNHDSVCWQAYHTIRKAILADSLSQRDKLIGTCEIDESYYGGKFKNLRKHTRQKLREAGLAKRGRGAKYRKQPVFGIYKRNGQIYLELMSDTTAKQLVPIIKERIKKGTTVYSDTYTAYKNLVGLGYLHATVSHGNEEYVSGFVHINGLEGFWGLSKNSLTIYKGIQKHNWIYYLKEMEFRYNYRDLTFKQRVEKIIQLLMSRKIPLSCSSGDSRLT